MVYRLILTTDEVPAFKRVFIVDPDISFLALHRAILSSVGYNDNEMTSFYMCDEGWEKGQEVTLVEMDKNFEYDNMTMEKTLLRDLLTEKGQRFIYVFDMMFERFFYGVVDDILGDSVSGVCCIEKRGEAPRQVADVPLDLDMSSDSDLGDLRDDLEGEDGYDEGDLDEEGFEKLSFEDGTMF